MLAFARHRWRREEGSQLLRADCRIVPDLNTHEHKRHCLEAWRKPRRVPVSLSEDERALRHPSRPCHNSDRRCE
jgi:hypothetical protein